MPESFQAKNVKLKIDSTSKKPSFEVAYDFVHNEIQTAKGNGIFVVNTTKEYNTIARIFESCSYLQAIARPFARHEDVQRFCSVIFSRFKREAVAMPAFDE